jgi:inositol-hexakisphosphate/diphosphoinositol-pentakisphosphate 1-kinase
LKVSASPLSRNACLLFIHSTKANFAFEKEVVQDLEEMQASDAAKSFFYFTKESHIYTLLNCILEGGIETKINRAAIPELDYLSQICFELYESETTLLKPGAAEVEEVGCEEEQTFKYSIRITISPGCHTFDPLDVQLDSKHCIGCAPRRSLTPHGDWKQVVETLRAKFHQYAPFSKYFSF